MKRIIDGKSYNTDTATEVFTESAPEPYGLVGDLSNSPWRIF